MSQNALWTGKRLGVIGAGNMAEALVRGVIAAGVISADRIDACDPQEARRDLFAGMGCAVSPLPLAIAKCEVVLLAVKPQVVRATIAEAAKHLKPDALIISIAAGVPLRVLAGLLAPETKIVRVMPNTPLLVSCGMSALARGSGVGDVHFELAMSLFSAAGLAVEVDESLLDAVTALSGSGPAYLFHFAEALEAGGREIGLPSELARTLAVATLRGAAEMLARGGDPVELRRQVTSPGGTTAAALKILDDANFIPLVVRALQAAQQRSIELGQNA